MPVKKIPEGFHTLTPYLVLNDAANVAVGDIVEVAIEPSQSAVKLEAPKRTLPTARMVRERVNRAKRKR